MEMKKNIFIYAVTFFVMMQSVCFAENLSAKSAIEKLEQGNKRFVKSQLKHPDQSFKNRIEGLKGQHPFAVILTCSDSRVSPEIIFDQGLGDLFEVRNAGNVIDDHVIGSIEYAVAHLHSPVVIVLGHQDCGAVKAAIEHDEETPHIKSLVDAIAPAVKRAEKLKGDLYDNAIRENIKLSVSELKKSKPILNNAFKQGKVEIIGAYYHIDSGEVEFLN